MAEPIPPVPAAAPAAPAAPSLPATVTLPSDPTPAPKAEPAAAAPAAPAAPAAKSDIPEPGAEGNHPATADAPDRAASWDNLFAPPGAAKPAEPAKPAEAAKPEPAPAAKPAEAPAAAKPAEPAKPAEVAKPAEEKDTDELPENIMEGIGETNPQNHREQIKRADKMGKRLRKAGDVIKGQKAEIEKLKQGVGAGTPPADYAETKQRLGSVETELQTKSKALEEAQDRLYATELTARPEYQEHVVKPWNAVQATVNTICKRYGQSPDDVWAAFRMAKPEERDAVFSEMLGVMNPLDQRRFTDAIEAVPRISKAQTVLEAHSKERLEAIRTQDKAKTEGERSNRITQAVAAQAEHYQTRMAALPGLYKMQGESEAAKTYNAGMDNAVKLAEQITRNGIDKLSPEWQGKMVHDAVTADYITRSLDGILQNLVARDKENATKILELETANKTLQSQLDEYNGALPGGGGLPPGGGGGSASPADAPLESRTAKHAKGFGWS